MVVSGVCSFSFFCVLGVSFCLVSVFLLGSGMVGGGGMGVLVGVRWVGADALAQPSQFVGIGGVPVGA